MRSIKRLLAMHRCTVLIVPKPICRLLGLHPGDYVHITVDQPAQAALITKIKLPEKTDHGNPQPPTPTPSGRRT